MRLKNASRDGCPIIHTRGILNCTIRKKHLTPRFQLTRGTSVGPKEAGRFLSRAVYRRYAFLCPPSVTMSVHHPSGMFLLGAGTKRPSSCHCPFTESSHQEREKKRKNRRSHRDRARLESLAKVESVAPHVVRVRNAHTHRIHGGSSRRGPLIFHQVALGSLLR